MMFLKKYGLVALIGILLTIGIAIAFSPPFHFTFVLAYQLKRILSLFLGGLYPIFMALFSLTPLSLVLIFIFVSGLLWGIWQVWRARRYPLLILITAMIGMNVVFVGTTFFLDAGRLTEPIVMCEDYFITGKTGFQMIRYPIEARLRDDAQTFILLSVDSGETWRQIFTAYAVNPQIVGCANIQANFNEDRVWSILIEQRIENSLDNETIRYATTDGGSTFERQDL